MNSDRIRLLALALLCAALTLAARRAASHAPERKESEVISAEESGATWVIPVEIVETGRAPRMHQVRIGQ
jgi:hypothetical protein